MSNIVLTLAIKPKLHMGEVVVQKLMKEVNNELELATRYYAVISALNSLNLSKRQIQLMAFTAIRGTITPLSARKEFAKLYNSSLNSIENIKGKLVKRGLMVKAGDKYKINPTIALNFSSDLVLQLNLKNKRKDEAN